MTLQLKIDPGQVSRMKAAIEGTSRSLRKELAIAVNKTAKKTKSQIAKKLSKDLNLAQKIVTRAVSASANANVSDLTATVEVKKEKRFNLTSFGGKETKTGVKYRTLRGKPYKIAPGSFQVDRWGGRTFKRVGKERGPLRNLRGPSPWGRFVVGKMIGPSAAETEAELKKQVNERIRFLLLKQAGTI